jgi:hypothetical protein
LLFGLKDGFHFYFVKSDNNGREIRYESSKVKRQVNILKVIQLDTNICLG